MYKLKLLLLDIIVYISRYLNFILQKKIIILLVAYKKSKLFEKL